MNLIEYALPGEWINALGWTVLHSFWQAAVVALLVGVLLYRMPQQPAWRRYWVAHLGWFSIIVCAVMTFFWYYHPQADSTLATITRLTPEGEAIALASPSFLGSYLHILSEYFNRHLPLIVSLWAMGMVFFLLRFLGGLIFLQHLRSYKVQAFSADWENKVKVISHQMGLTRSVQLLESALVKVPMVIGWMKPVILLPIGALNALSSQEVEAILAHELAHIKRHDYVLNLIRSLVEVLFYFNPAVWWLSAQIRMEREHCCDDMALEVCGDSLSYVRALVALQELSQRPGIGLAMTFVRSKPELLNRVRRILNQPKDKSDLMEKLVITCLLLIALSFTLLSATLPGEEVVEVMPATPQLESNAFVEKVMVESEPLLHLSSTTDHSITVEVHEVHKIIELKLDTIPKGVIQLKTNKNGKAYDVKIRDNKIQRLSIDGKLIPEKELVNHYDLVQELLDDMPPPPPAPPAPPALDAPPAPPAPPAPVAPEKKRMVPIAPSPSTPPAPPAPPSPSTLAPPPPPPSPRIRLVKPVEGEGRTSMQFYQKGNDDVEVKAETGQYVWRTKKEEPTVASVWVSSEGDPSDNGVVVVRVNEGEVLHESMQDVVVELITDTEDQPSNQVVVGNNFEFKGEDTKATFYRRTENGKQPGNNRWQQDLETKMLSDHLLEPGEGYQIEISGNRLLINGKEQSTENHKKYLHLLEQSLDQPLDDSAMYLFNRRSKQREE